MQTTCYVTWQLYEPFSLLFCHAVQNAVKTSFSRPPSKPRVRNPLTLLRSHSQGQGISPPLSGSGYPPIPNIGSTHSKTTTDSPTQLEKDFLAMGGANAMPPSSWGEGSQDEEFFTLIPDDTVMLDSSLSTSLSSICGPGNKDAEDGSKDAEDGSEVTVSL